MEIQILSDEAELLILGSLLRTPAVSKACFCGGHSPRDGPCGVLSRVACTPVAIRRLLPQEGEGSSGARPVPAYSWRPGSPHTSEDAHRCACFLEETREATLPGTSAWLAADQQGSRLGTQLLL